jgi:hypothetical protein
MVWRVVAREYLDVFGDAIRDRAERRLLPHRSPASVSPRRNIVSPS